MILSSWGNVEADASREVPSAKSQVPKSDEFGISLIKIRNKSGPRTLPCGTPHSISSSSETPSIMQVNCFLFDR